MNELLATPSPYKGSIECIESWHNEDYTQWYRVYSDGWCEQGGCLIKDSSSPEQTIIFKKPFINTNYHYSTAIPFNTGNGGTPSCEIKLASDKKVDSAMFQLRWNGGARNIDMSNVTYKFEGYIK